MTPLYTKFKTPEVAKEYAQLRERAQIISEDMAIFCRNYQMDYVITDIMSDSLEDKKLKRVSKSHSEGRAWDVRTHGWTDDFKMRFKTHFERVYKEWAAVSAASGEKNLIVYHNSGFGHHAHIQIMAYKES